MTYKKALANALTEIGLNYAYNRWNSKEVKYPYWIGNAYPAEPETEDGALDVTFTLSGFNRGDMSDLEKDIDKIYRRFRFGETFTTGRGTAKIFIGSVNPIETDDIELKRIELDLKIKIWEV